MAQGGDCVATYRPEGFDESFFADDGKAFRQALIEGILALPEQEQYVMSMHYEHDMKLKEIAAVLRVTESRVCQIKSCALARLRAIVLA